MPRIEFQVSNCVLWETNGRLFISSAENPRKMNQNRCNTLKICALNTHLTFNAYNKRKGCKLKWNSFACVENLEICEICLMTLSIYPIFAMCAFFLSSTFEFSLDVFSVFSDKSFVKKRLFEHETFCVRDQDVTTEPARHRLERGSLHQPQFILQRFFRIPEFAQFTNFLFHLGKPLSVPSSTIM